MTRLYGRCSRGEHLVVAPCAFDGPMNGEKFRASVEQFLVPELKPGDIVILDNLSSHKVEGVRTAIESAKARLLYLPSYTLISTRSSNGSPS